MARGQSIAAQREPGVLAGPTSGRQILATLVVVNCLLVLVIHSPALSTDALFMDDEEYLVQNPLVQTPGWTSIRRFVSEALEPSTVRGYYQPLTMISLMADYWLGGRAYNLFPFRRTSLSLHIANVALLTVLLYLLFRRPLVAAAVGLLFGVHPMTVEPICWLSARKTLLASLFGLSSLVAYVAYGQRRKWPLYAACLLAYTLALLSKPTALPLPAMMLLLDFWPLRRFSRQSVLDKLPLFAVGAVLAIVAFVSQSRTSLAVLPHMSNWISHAFVVCRNLLFYPLRMLWPANLSCYYGFPKSVGLSDPMVAAGVISHAILVPLLGVSLRRTRSLLTGWLVFAVGIFPSAGLVRFAVVIAADRYAYLPSLGLLLVLAWVLIRLGDIGRKRCRRAMYLAPVPALALLILVGAESFGTRRYLAHWRDTLSLHEHMLAMNPTAAPLHHNMGVVLQSQGDIDNAIARYERACQLDPGYRYPYYNLGVLRMSRHEFAEAIGCFRAALQIEAGDAWSLYNLGKALTMTGNIQEALARFHESARLGTDKVSALVELAWLRATHPAVRDPNEAVHLAERACAITRGRSARALDVLAAAYAADGRYREAVETAQNALQVARRRRDHELGNRIEERLRLYEMKSAYTETPGVQFDEFSANVNNSRKEHE